jgi:hypothetical protein
MRGEEVPNTVDLTPNFKKKNPSATSVKTAHGVHPQQRQRQVKPVHGSETFGEARALVGGPKHSRSTTHDEKEPKPTHDNATANHGNSVDGRDWNESEKTQPPRSTPKKKKNPKNPERQREKEEDVRKEEKRKGGKKRIGREEGRGKRGRDKALPSSSGIATGGGERGGKQRILKKGWRASLSKK